MRRQQTLKQNQRKTQRKIRIKLVKRPVKKLRRPGVPTKVRRRVQARMPNHLRRKAAPSQGRRERLSPGEDAAQNSSASSPRFSSAERRLRRGQPGVRRRYRRGQQQPCRHPRRGEVDSSRERLGNASPRAPERVTGSRRDGPLSFAGETLRQGDAPDTLPQNGSAAYRRAAEEVIREGRIPLEYQEIVRDYFR